ncbi:CPBP family intramembrane glutamic endopeptidase [Haloarchaeobius litoreus]|uniref:CPBP family intramembrane glutamic endopeptidase n=1 Tax=Haloarchaeobius litoreus TaxID=755306 RepID=A0ABD6DMK8_9EURY|nr:type II CAAX endopeptidase family protein [Haloarchaeobius litoreus]
MDESFADGRGSSSPRGGGSPVDIFKTFVRFLLLGFGSLALLFVIQIALYLVTVSVLGPVPDGGLEVQLITFLSLGLGTLIVAAAYLENSGRDWSFVDVELPSLRDVAWTIGGFVILILGFLAVISLFDLLGLSPAEHSSTDSIISATPEVILLVLVAQLLVVGPGEELLYRNVIQKSLYDVVTRPVAVVLASVIFSLVHIPAYSAGGASLGGVATTLAAIFVLSLVLGGVYARTENVVVPAVIHGSYNVLSFYSTYATGGEGGGTEALLWLL